MDTGPGLKTPFRIPNTTAIGSKLKPSADKNQGQGHPSLETGEGGTGANLRKVFEDLNNTRVRLEQDQRDYEKARRINEGLDKDIAKLKAELEIGSKEQNELLETAAKMRTELKYLEIRDKIVSESLEKGEKELETVVSELHQLRMKSSHDSSEYLRDAMVFGTIYSGNEYGRQNRVLERESELDELMKYKRQLETELSDFLVLSEGVKQCESELEALKKEFEEQDEQVSKHEEELQERRDMLDLTLFDLEREEEELHKASNEECEKLQREIEETQQRITDLENLGKEAKSVIKAQKDSTVGATASATQVNPEIIEQEQSNDATIGKSSKSPGIAATVSGRTMKPMAGSSGLNRFKFQPPTSVNSTLNVDNTVPDPSMEANCFDDDDDDLIAAAEAVSQSIRSYEPMTQAPTYGPPSKIRVVEKQASLHPTSVNSFMKQSSSTKVIKRPPKTQASQGKGQTKNETTQPKTQVAQTEAQATQTKVQSTLSITPATQVNPQRTQWKIQPKKQIPAHVPIPASSSRPPLSHTQQPTTRKSFQFKKKASISNTSFSSYAETSSESGFADDRTTSLNASGNTSHTDTSFFGPTTVSVLPSPEQYEKDFDDYSYGDFETETVPNRSSDMNTDRPYSSFHSSRVLLTESQEERLFM